MRRALSSVLLAAGALLVWDAPAAAQIAVMPDTVAVSLAEGETVEVTLAVADAGGDSTRAWALSLAPPPGEGDPPEPPGEFLFATTPDALSFGTYDLTMTPKGRMFAAGADGRNKTVELTASLDFVNEFEHPTTSSQSFTSGLAYNDNTAKLWWLDFQGDSFEIEQALLLEGSLDGTATGNTFAAPFGDGACGYTTGRPVYLAYDSAHLEVKIDLFYYIDVAREEIWSIDTLGAAAVDYPVLMTGYAGVPRPPDNPEGCLINGGFDAHALGGEPVFEVSLGIPFNHPHSRVERVVVTDRAGQNRGAETSLFDLPTPDGFGIVQRLYGIVRSRLDPSVLYLSVWTGLTGDIRHWVYAVRAAPLPPVWLHARPILFETEGTAETNLTLSLDASGLEPGVYEAVASVREGDGIGEVLVDVPVTLTVTPPVDSEDEVTEPSAFALGEPYPNPAADGVTVPVVLGDAAEVSGTVFDVLGREVARLADGPMEAGRHALTLDGAALPAGVYLVRATSGEDAVTRRFTVMR